MYTDFCPVLTMILHYGMHHCKYKANLKELIQVPKELEPFINDYIVNNVFEIAWLSEEQVKKFQSDFQVVTDYFVQKRTKPEYTPSTKVIRHVDATLKLMTVLTKTDWQSEVIKRMQKEGKEITMVSAYAEVEKRGYDKGVKYGKAQIKTARSEAVFETRRDNAARMLKAGKLSEEDISAYTGLSVAEVEDLKKNLNS